MQAIKSLVISALCPLLTFMICVQANTYNFALSSNVGASISSSTPFGTAADYGPQYANDGVITFCNNAIKCPGPYAGKLFKSLQATTSNDVWL
jgi:hypothetical protein